MAQLVRLAGTKGVSEHAINPSFIESVTFQNNENAKVRMASGFVFEVSVKDDDGIEFFGSIGVSVPDFGSMRS